MFTRQSQAGLDSRTVRRNLNEYGIKIRRFDEQQLMDNDRGLKVNLNRLKSDVEKDPRFFYVLGAFKGDGHYNIKQNKIQISVIDVDFLEEIKRVFNTLSPETRLNIIIHGKPKERCHQQYRINICCKDFFKRNLHKLLPKTLEEKRFYMKGLFDAEGSIGKVGHINITQNSKADLNLWHEYLRDLGINTSKTYYTSDTGKIHNSLNIIGKESKINFKDIIDFRITRKKKRLDEYIKKIFPFKEYEVFDSNVNTVKVKSITFSHREQGVDLSILDCEYHNFLLDNNIVSSNSTLALQIAYYIAWIMAGGKMVWEKDAKGKIKVVGMYPPTKKVNFSLDNIVFDPDSLMKKASELPRNSVIVYDEGRAGLDSARAMESINKAMQDFFQECGFYGHIIIIVLPNFFKLHEDYAVARSIFLVDVFHDKEFKRGYFNFYNDRRKENLYFFGKKRIGVSAKYAATDSNFYGRFGEFLPVDKVEYEKLKKEAILKKQMSRYQAKFKKQRDAAIYLSKKYSNLSSEVLAQELSIVSGTSCTGALINDAIVQITRQAIQKEDEESDIESIKVTEDKEDNDNDPNYKPEIVPDPVYDDEKVIENEKEEVIDFKEAFKDLQQDES